MIYQGVVSTLQYCYILQFSNIQEYHLVFVLITSGKYQHYIYNNSPAVYMGHSSLCLYVIMIDVDQILLIYLSSTSRHIQNRVFLFICIGICIWCKVYLFTLHVGCFIILIFVSWMSKHNDQMIIKYQFLQEKLSAIVPV